MRHAPDKGRVKWDAEDFRILEWRLATVVEQVCGVDAQWDFLAYCRRYAGHHFWCIPRYEDAKIIAYRKESASYSTRKRNALQSVPLAERTDWYIPRLADEMICRKDRKRQIHDPTDLGLQKLNEVLQDALVPDEEAQKLQALQKSHCNGMHGGQLGAAFAGLKPLRRKATNTAHIESREDYCVLSPWHHGRNPYLLPASRFHVTLPV